jgi:hypothetical protein
VTLKDFVPVSDQKQAISILGELQKNNIEITAFNLSRPVNRSFLSLTGKNKGNPDDSENNTYNTTEEQQATLSINQLLEHVKPSHQSGLLGNKLMFGWRNLVKIKHIPEQFMDVLITPIMFTFMFTYLFGGALAGSTKAYLQFFIPGILVGRTFNAMYAGININNVCQRYIRSLSFGTIWLPAPLSAFYRRFFELISGTLVLLFGFILGFRTDGCLRFSFLIMIFFAIVYPGFLL